MNARDELADAIMEIYGDASAEQLADALMPVVERIANKRAATELREMATVTANGDDRWQLRDRAYELEKAVTPRWGQCPSWSPDDTRCSLPVDHVNAHVSGESRWVG